MIFLKEIWQKFKENPDWWFFCAFLLTLPLSIRKIITFYPIKDAFNEFGSIPLYLSDIFLLFTLFSWIFIILRNNSFSLSRLLTAIPKLSTKKVIAWLKCSTPAPLNVPRLPRWFKMFHVEHFKTFWGGTFSSGWNILRDKLIYIPLFLVFWSFLSISWSDNYSIAFFRSIKLLEFFLLYLYLKERFFYISSKCSTFAPLNVPRLPRWFKMFHVEHFKAFWGGTFSSGWNILKIILPVFIFWGLSESIIGVWQFLAQHSIGLFWLKESLISPDISGVAKIIIGHERYIRTYGLFPHPNILGGFLLISILFTYLYQKINVPRLSALWRDGTIWNILLGIQIIALILTFSKSAIIGLIIAIIYIFINQKEVVPSQSDVPRLPRETRNVPPQVLQDCSTWNNLEEGGKRGTFSSFTGVEHFRKLKYYFLISLAIFGFLLFYFQIDIVSLFLRSLEERFIFLAISIKAILEHLFLGLGQGQFVLEMEQYASVSLESWQFQPVHNVFLLILSELGMIGLFLFVWFLLEIFSIVPSQSNCSTLVPLDVPRGTLFHVEHSERDGTFSGFTGVEQFNLYIKAIILGFIFIMIFDHYLWDIQQGSLMLWMMLGLIVAKK